MGESINNHIVISCVNFTEGGPLTIIHSCLDALKLNNPFGRVTVLVHKKNLYKDYLADFEFLEYPAVKSSWIKRIKFEYFHSKTLSQRLQPDIWLSLHDITPNVNCPLQLVYCHNPSPFYTTSLSEVAMDYKFFLFSHFYKYLYKINIKKNKYVIVQQDWLRKKFEEMYHVQTIVAYPFINKAVEISDSIVDARCFNKAGSSFNFFYPAFPRTFKNFELIIKAGVELYKVRKDFSITITISENQSKYGDQLLKAYKKYKFIDFVGKQSLSGVQKLYSSCDCLIFPSKLETWGLPLSEFQEFKKPILASDLDYAHEAVGNYPFIKFFDPDDHRTLFSMMNNLMEGTLAFDKNEIACPKMPFFRDWNSLLAFINNIKDS